MPPPARRRVAHVLLELFQRRRVVTVDGEWPGLDSLVEDRYRRSIVGASLQQVNPSTLDVKDFVRRTLDAFPGLPTHRAGTIEAVVGVYGLAVARVIAIQRGLLKVWLTLRPHDS